jgi:hypothetical protein
MATYYAIHVRRKTTSDYQTQLSIGEGKSPDVGDVIEADLRGEKVKARVTNITTNPNKAKGEPVANVYAEEI